MSTTTDELRADTMYSNTIDAAYPAITPSGMAAPEILETLTAKITAATSAVGMQAEIGWLTFAHEVTRSRSRRPARRRDPPRLRRRTDRTLTGESGLRPSRARRCTARNPIPMVNAAKAETMVDPQMFTGCVLAGCSNIVAEVGEICSECRRIFGDMIRPVSERERAEDSDYPRPAATGGQVLSRRNQRCDCARNVAPVPRSVGVPRLHTACRRGDACPAGGHLRCPPK